MKREPLKWVGGEHVFALYLGEMRALQEAADAGPEEVLIRMRSGRWRVDDLMQVLRLGLIGGGMDEAGAGRLVVNLFELHPLLVFKATALQVLMMALTGPEDDQPGKDAGAGVDAPESGPSASSTETEEKSG